MNVLGIKPSLSNGTPLKGGGRHDAGACLVRDREIVAAAEEERFTRNKHALDEFPHFSIEYVLDAADLSLADIDVIGIGRDRSNRTKLLRDAPAEHLVPTSPTDLFSLFREVSTQVAVRRGVHVDLVDREIHRGHPATSPPTGAFTGTYETVSHHRCHAASAAYCADADRPVVVTVDARGEHDSTVLWDRDLRRVKTFSAANSIGVFYAAGVNYLGYPRGWDAGKVMGLASHGEYRERFDAGFDSLVEVGGGEYDVTAITDASDPVGVLEDTFGPRRPPTDEFSQRHRDFAHHLQSTTERIVTHLVDSHLADVGHDRLALAGGVALNCKLNREIRRLDRVASLFVQPAANDSGLCLGAALEAVSRASGARPDPTFDTVYYGPGYDTAAIESALTTANVDYESVADPAVRAAALLAEGNVIGWFQGRMEFGPRALGNRSILANPTAQAYADEVNRGVKHRESWRPFAPSILDDHRSEYLSDGAAYPYMIVLDSVPEAKREEVPAVTHVDGTTRPQTVSKADNPRYYDLIEAFHRHTGVPVVLNTSFNVSGQPIVESPEQALSTFYSTGLDALVIGEYLLTK
jgi:carbamoyltransferase